MNCRVCGNMLFPGRVVFRCSCGAFTHAHCWKRHIVDSHRPFFVVGDINLAGEGRVKGTRTRDSSHSLDMRPAEDRHLLKNHEREELLR